MRLVVAVALALTASASAATGNVVVVPKPAFPPPPTSFTAPAAGLRLQLVSTTRRNPASSAAVLELFDLPANVPRRLSGEPIWAVVEQPGTTFVVYGTNVIAAFGPMGGMKYAFDLRSLGFPPRSIAPRAYGPQEVVWARQLGRLLVVQTAHLGYATDSANRNGYLTAIDLDTGKVRWRSPSLVANAQNFAVTRGLIVAGYGFTAEKDWLYLVDPATGRVRDRLALPSMAEQISVRGNRIVVHAYDATVVLRLVERVSD